MSSIQKLLAYACVLADTDAVATNVTKEYLFTSVHADNHSGVRTSHGGFCAPNESRKWRDLHIFFSAKVSGARHLQKRVSIDKSLLKGCSYGLQRIQSAPILLTINVIDVRTLLVKSNLKC